MLEQAAEPLASREPRGGKHAVIVSSGGTETSSSWTTHSTFSRVCGASGQEGAGAQLADAICSLARYAEEGKDFVNNRSGSFGLASGQLRL